MSLDELRKQIDEIDSQLIELLRKRAGAAKEIGEYKAERGLSTYVPEREHVILARIGETDFSPLNREAAIGIYREIISACRALEEPLRVAFLGPEHTFSHLAARKQFGSACELTPCRSPQEVFAAVERRTADFAVVPFENSTEGAVPATLNSLVSADVTVCGELYIPVEHYVVAKCALEEVLEVHSHPQPLGQCRSWLHQNLPNAVLVPASSSAAAAQMAAERPNTAAIATRPAAEAYGLEILAERIQDIAGNRTRFLVIGHHQAAPTNEDKTSLVLAVPHKAGSLYESLSPFAEHGINLTMIQSWPVAGWIMEYVFFIDFYGHQKSPEVERALGALKSDCPFVKVLGSYPAAE